MKPKLTAADYARAALTLGCEVAVIRAVAQKESSGGGFLAGSNLLTVRFEGHVFRRLTEGRYDKSHPRLSHRYRRNNPHNRGVVRDWQRLEEARVLAGDVAFEAASYGMFQIMGFHYALLGFESAYAMMLAFDAGEGPQLDGFVQFILRNGLADELRERRFDDFGLRYNGADAAANNYGPDMHRLYEHYRTLA